MTKDLQRNPEYRCASINELEVIFEGARKQVSVLNALRFELSHRSTERAKRLRSQIEVVYPEDSIKQGQSDFDRGTVNSANVQDNATSPQSVKTTTPSLETDLTARLPDEIPPLVKLNNRPSIGLPQRNNEPTAILSTWTALEALDPQTYRRPFDLTSGDRRRIVDLKGKAVPWPKGRSIPNHSLYYQIPLGTISMAKATQALVNAFGANEEQNPRQTEQAVMAAVLVDSKGMPVEKNSVAISSLTWALPEALKGNLSSLGDWVSIEQVLVRALEDILQQRNANGDAVPLTRARIDIAHQWLKRQFDLDESMVAPTSFAIRKYHYYKSKEPPEVELLNSFFLRDLERARSAVSVGKEPNGLGRYLGDNRPQNVRDLLSDNAAVEEAVAPAMTTPCRWPSPGGFPLVLLQQAAVNLARNELVGNEGITAVNGPPGTGKTTLLRDVVAGCVLDRAKAMAAFSDPVKAFSPSGEKIAMGSNAFFHLYKLDPSMKGHEIIVASSNNKAVENVSRELPAFDATGRELDDLNYLRTLSNRVYASPSKETGASGQPIPGPEADTWGMIAAVLGNGKNRGAFVQSFWWNQDCGFQTYLKAVQGKPTVREIRDEEGKIVRREVPKIVKEENPPSPDLAKRNWTKAKRRFQTILSEVEEELASLEKVRSAVRNLSLMREKRVVQLDDCDALSKFEQDCASTLREQRAKHADAEHRLVLAQGALSNHDVDRPNFLIRLFRMQRFRTWLEVRQPLLTEHSVAKTEELRTGQNIASALAEHQKHARLLEELNNAIVQLESKIEQTETLLAPWRDRLGDRIVDDAFFDRGHEMSHLGAPWIPDELHRKREEVFIAAMGLHKAFIDSCAQKVQHNIAVLMKALQDGSLPDENKRALLPDLWSTLFSIVPVISTTFASVDRMMADLPIGSIGWLLVDEAGQATPQAAVGAIMRSQRTIVVGDLLQIPPVVTLPDQLVSLIAKEFRVEPLDWTAPVASAQTVADRASRHQGEFRGDAEPRRVGIPLLVHRRCQDPMFGISNEIAYNGQMVHAAGALKLGAVTEALGRSRWFDIDGEAETKWCPAEGDYVVRLLQELVRKNVLEPDLFIVSPFRDVANGIRTRLRSEAALFEALGVDLDEWL
ncbi:MAG: helicase [Robiginitomaculum sp.]|nr:MAG: helicase [Robiginitomaculum sp.]